jgi:hypothetical protein
MVRWTGLTALIFGTGDTRGTPTSADEDQQYRNVRNRSDTDLTSAVYNALSESPAAYREVPTPDPLPENPPF